MKIKGIIFDLDGVVCSTDEYHYAAWKSLADELGIYFDRAINDRLRGVSRMASLDIILERSGKQYTDEEKSRLANLKNARYVELLQNLTPDDVLPGIHEFLKECQENGMKAIGIGTTETLSEADILLNSTDKLTLRSIL